MSRPRFALAVLVGAILLAPAVGARAQEVARERTPGGLTFRHIQMPEDTYQTLYFAWRDGSGLALPGREGVAGLGATLVMEGPRGLARSAMVEDLRDQQAAANLFATTNFVQGYLSAPPAKFAAAAEIMARTFAEPALPEARLAQLVKNRLIAIRQAEGNAEALAQRLFWRLILSDGPYRRLATSDPAIYERVTVGDVDAWRRSILVRDNATVVAVGPFDAAQAGREIDRIFAGLPQTGASFSPAKPVLLAPGKLVVLEKAVVQTAIVAGGPMDLVVSPDLVQAEIAASVIGGGSRGRLFKAVREKLGAAYGASAGLATVDATTRAFAIRTAVANDKANAALAAIREQFADFLSAGVAEEELRPLQNVYVAAHQERLRRAPTLAPNLLSQTLNGFPDDFLATYERRVRGYDIAGTNDAIRKLFPRQPLTTVVVAPSAEGLAADCVIKAPAEIGRCE